MLLPWLLNLLMVGDPPDEQLAFFESRIRPVLAEHCYECHNSSGRAEGGLAIDHRAGLLQGGDRGSIVVPGRPQDSRLLAVLRHEIAELKMPEGGPKLSDEIAADFASWITEGAFDPRDAPPSAQQLAETTSWDAVFARRSTWWSLQPVRSVEPPAISPDGWSAHPVDRFVHARMQQEGLQPAARADKPTLLRRATFVLTGLPPTPAELQAFTADNSPTAFERVVDRLLNSPRFGERWARHWMDLMRYSESHGSQGDPELPNAFQYRDYLIRAFNDDVPYDQLVREHLAGDLLSAPRLNTAEGWNESAIGTAHLRMVELGFVPVDALDDQMKVVDNQIDVYSKAFLGLTVSCARCHHHKFDAISQDDFYALYGIFVSSRPGQILIDSPDRLQTNRGSLQQLHESIRGNLADAWLAAAAGIPDRLREQSERAARLQQLTERLRQLQASVAGIEDPARALVLQRRGLTLSGGLPQPDARWSFEGDARDSAGPHHGELLSGAVIRNGRLILDGVGANMRTALLDRDIHEKTLEAWVALANLDQRGGGVIGLETPEGRFFDAIVFGELTPRHWLPGSDFFNRTQDPGGAAETAGPEQLVHVAMVYAKDNSITFYRNGRQSGSIYQKGVLQPFLQGRSRFLFGQRLSDINPPLAGEIEEARAYTRPLSAAEIALSYQAGPAGITTAEIVEVLSAEQRMTLQTLTAEQSAVQQQLTRLRSAAAAWEQALADAQTNPGNPLHLWQQVNAASAAGTAAVQQQWQQQADLQLGELQRRQAMNAERFQPRWDLRHVQAGEWYASGTGLAVSQAAMAQSVTNSEELMQRGGLAIEPEGDRIVRSLSPAAVLTHSLSSRHTGVLQSRRFLIDSDNIFVRAWGQNSQVRLVIENYPLGNGGLYPAVRLNRDEPGWLRLDTAYRRGSHAWLEFTTDAAERAYFGVTEVLSGDQPELPLETVMSSHALLRGTVPTSLDEVAERYRTVLQEAVQAWKARTLTDEQAAFLNFFVQRDLLPTQRDSLASLWPLVEQYRQLEREIPVPRRVPGVLEAAGIDHPLWERGQLTRPGRIVPRRGPQVLGSEPFATVQSGRLQLAEQTASGDNPLTARVLVNRLWQHAFGEGLVRTVDNFGRLGELPTHPELLDYLAARFVRDEGWSMKRMLRLLLTSETWQQSSRGEAAGLERDGANRWLSRMSLRRLEAEAIRDAILAVSGQLDLKMYGPGVSVYFVSRTEGGGAPGPLDGDRRRSVYQRIRRNAFNPFLEAFDAPRPATTRGRRDVTNVPLQALTMLNDPFVIDQAAKWGALVVAEGASTEQRIGGMFLRAFGREISAGELRAAQEYLADLCGEHGVPTGDVNQSVAVWQDFAQSVFCLKEFLYVH